MKKIFLFTLLLCSFSSLALTNTIINSYCKNISESIEETSRIKACFDQLRGKQKINFFDALLIETLTEKEMSLSQNSKRFRNLKIFTLFISTLNSDEKGSSYTHLLKKKNLKEFCSHQVSSHADFLFNCHSENCIQLRKRYLKDFFNHYLNKNGSRDGKTRAFGRIPKHSYHKTFGPAGTSYEKVGGEQSRGVPQFYTNTNISSKTIESENPLIIALEDFSKIVKPLHQSFEIFKELIHTVTREEPVYLDATIDIILAQRPDFQKDIVNLLRASTDYLDHINPFKDVILKSQDPDLISRVSLNFLSVSLNKHHSYRFWGSQKQARDNNLKALQQLYDHTKEEEFIKHINETLTTSVVTIRGLKEGNEKHLLRHYISDILLFIIEKSKEEKKLANFLKAFIEKSHLEINKRTKNHINKITENTILDYFLMTNPQIINESRTAYEVVESFSIIYKKDGGLDETVLKTIERFYINRINRLDDDSYHSIRKLLLAEGDLGIRTFQTIVDSFESKQSRGEQYSSLTRQRVEDLKNIIDNSSLIYGTHCSEHMDNFKE